MLWKIEEKQDTKLVHHLSAVKKVWQNLSKYTIAVESFDVYYHFLWKSNQKYILQ